MSFCKLGRFTSTHYFSHYTVTVWITNKIDSIYSKFSTCDRLLSYTVFVLANDNKYRQNALSYSINWCSHQTCSRHRDKTTVQMPTKMFPYLKLFSWLFMGPTLGLAALQRNTFLTKFDVFLQ
jgi:hypothetical protein